MPPPPPLPPPDAFAHAPYGSASATDEWIPADESIDDVLALFLNDLDALQHQVPPPTPPPVSAIDARAKDKSKRKRVRTGGSANTTWRRQKEEIAILRGQVGALQSQLEMLRTQQLPAGRRVASSIPDLREESTNEPLDRTPADSKKRLQHEIEAGRSATVQNSKLRKLADDALELTQRMKSAFAKYPLPSASAVLEMCPRVEIARVPDAQIYCKLKTILDTRCPGVGPASTPIGFDASVLLNNSRVVPFSIRLINDVIWNDNGIEKMQMIDSQIKLIHKVGSIMFMEKHYVFRDSTTNEAAVCILHTVAKRIYANGRIVTAWESMGDWPSELAGISSEHAHVSVREHGWATLQPVVGSDDGSPLSVLNASTILLPDFAGGSSQTQGASQESTTTLSKMFLDAIVPTHNLAFKARMQAVENLLLDHTLAARR